MPDFPELNIVDSCSNCGACCTVQGAPPDYVALKLNPHFRDDASFADDLERLLALTGTPLQLLDEYLQQSAAGQRPTDGPCVWFDQERLQCRYYDQRPSTCRVFELGSPGCYYYRKQAGID